MNATNMNALKNNTKKNVKTSRKSYKKLKSYKNLKIPENKPNKIMQRKTRKFSFF